MTQPPPPDPSTWRREPPAAPPRRPLALGIVVGALTPLFSLSLAMLTDGRFPGVVAWVLVAVTGVVMLGFDRTRRWGQGVLLGFCGMLVVGAGVCTLVLAGLEGAYGAT